MDVDGDGDLDVITGGFWGKTLQWRENPAEAGKEWTLHAIEECGSIETTRFWDVNGDGLVEAYPNANGNIIGYELIRDKTGNGTGKFDRHVIKEGGCGHGLGFGDVNGDGLGDFIIPDGWIEAPADPWKGKWILHNEFNLGGMPSVPILVHDVNEDGQADLIVGAAHGYGLWWMEQGKGVDGNRTWTHHDIAPERSQYHDMQLVDIDQDGKLELVTGKRYRAHQEHDPGSADPLGTYYFNINGGQFERVTLDYGPAGKASGVGIYFWVEDIDQNGWLDVLAPGKEGLYLFLNKGTELK
jgi:hypothetical protein